MGDAGFLHRLAEQLLNDFQGKLHEVTVVLPNKRARIFLLHALKEKILHTEFAPQIKSIEEFTEEMAQIRGIDTIELLFEFYEVYRKVTPATDQQSFELFANWAQTLLQDFNEIDRYLLDPDHVFSYLKDIEAIKRWDLRVEDMTELIEEHLHFWNRLPLYYKSLYDHLVQKKAGYQGLIYREAVQRLPFFLQSLKQNIIFAGFNALNQAEEQIFQKLLATGQAKVYWDVDSAFMNDPYHDAGLFARKIKNKWTYYKTHPYEWISDHFSGDKNIEIIGTPKAVGQAKIAGNLIKKITDANETLSNVAVVLGTEDLLIPLLYSLPDTVNSLNITMGYSGKNNPAQIVVSGIFRMHQNACTRNRNTYVFYYKEVLEVLNNPLLKPYIEADNLIEKIHKNNYTFFSYEKMQELHPDYNALFELVFQKWDDSPADILNRLGIILLKIKSRLESEGVVTIVNRAFLYATYKGITKLVNYISAYPYVTSVELLYMLYKQIADLVEVSFEGEPLEGLQVMGVLESRVLDFETVIITSMNEGTFPAGKSHQSFIPYDVKRELGLPTYKEKDAIYAYHFYHLLQRAKKIYLLYNTENEGIDAGEKSRFITQLEIEPREKHHITHEVYQAHIPDQPYRPVVVPKSDLVMKRLREIAENGFSPSSLTTYIRNPIQFYFQRILQIREAEEVEESIAVNTLGTIIHETLEALYKPLIGVSLTPSHLETLLEKADDEVLHQFRQVYKEGEIRKGRNLLAFEVAKRHVFHFLNYEKNCLLMGEAITVLNLEETFEYWLNDPRLPYPVKIRGNIDRIDQRNGHIRIIDYKSGKVDKYTLSLKSWEGLTADSKNDKIIQLLCYALMYSSEKEDSEIEAGIISFKNIKEGFMPFRLKEGREVTASVIDANIMADFKEQLVILLTEILTPHIAFREQVEVL